MHCSSTEQGEEARLNKKNGHDGRLADENVKRGHLNINMRNVNRVEQAVRINRTNKQALTRSSNKCCCESVQNTRCTII